MFSSNLKWLTWLSIRSLVSSPGRSIMTLVSLFIPLPSLWLFPSFIIKNSLRPRRRDWDRRATPLSSPAPEKNEGVYCFFPRTYFLLLTVLNQQTIKPDKANLLYFWLWAGIPHNNLHIFADFFCLFYRVCSLINTHTLSHLVLLIISISH